MALIGGGGTGNVAGGNPSGTGSSVNYIGNHVYGYSGSITCGTNYTRLMKFTMGNSYAKIRFNPVYFTEDTGEDCFWQVLIDEQAILHIEITSSAAATPLQEVTLILPSFAEITIQAKAASATRLLGATIAGRVY